MNMFVHSPFRGTGKGFFMAFSPKSKGTCFLPAISWNYSLFLL